LSSVRVPEGAAIDYGELCKCFVSVIWRSARDTVDSTSSIDGEVVKIACNLLIFCITPPFYSPNPTATTTKGPHLLDQVFAMSNFDEFLFEGLLDSSEQEVREEMMAVLDNLYR